MADKSYTTITIEVDDDLYKTFSEISSSSILTISSNLQIS